MVQHSQLMFKKFKNHIDNELSFLYKKRLFIAVSGGLDSMVLLRFMQYCKFDIAVLHCNFNLRAEESSADEFFLEQYCLQNKLPFFVKSFDTKAFAETNKRSTQIAARELRYIWFSEMLQLHNFDYVLTAHHLDDSLETFLINLSRGTGLDGLTGIPAINSNIIRPLLPFSRQEIEAFAVENNIVWREDSSNKSDYYLRNKIRHHIIPELKAISENFLNNFEKTQYFLQKSSLLVDDAVSNFYKIVVSSIAGNLHFDIKLLLKFNHHEQYLFQSLKSFGFSAWNDIYGLVEAENGKKVLSATHQIQKYRNFLILSKLDNGNHFDEFEIATRNISVKFPINLSICKVDNISVEALNCIFVDGDFIDFPLKLRHPKNGDVFYPKGMIGSKKVLKFLKDQRITPIERVQIWLLVNTFDEVVWVIGFRQDQRFMANNDTKNILKIIIE